MSNASKAPTAPSSPDEELNGAPMANLAEGEAQVTASEELEIYEHEASQSASETIFSQDDSIQLSPGESLTIEETFPLLCARPAIFITIIGDTCSGKTTLLYSIYDRFLHGKYANFCFSSSKTLIAFEKIAHLSRIDSGYKAPDTLRTSRHDGLKFFHLELMNVETSSKVALLISDRAGEFYQQVRNNPDQVESLFEISRADWVLFLIDGEKIANPYERNHALQSTRQTLRAFLDNGSLNASSRVQIVTTKCDIIQQEKEEERDIIDTAKELFRTNLIKDFSPRVQALSFFETSARDPSGKLPAAFGVDKLLESWARPNDSYIPQTYSPLELSSQFDKLLLRTPMGAWQ